MNDRPATFLASWTAHLLDRVSPPEQQAQLLAQLGIDAESLRKRDGRLAYDSAVALWSTLTDAHSDELFGLNLAEQTPLAALGVLGYLAASSETLGGAFQRIVGFERLLKDPGQLELRSDERDVRIRELPPAGRAIWPRHLSEAILMTYVVLARRWTGEPLRPRAVRFQHAAPRAGQELERRFGCAVAFAAPVNELVFDADVLALRLRNADETLAVYLESIASHQLAELPPEDVLLADVRKAILELLPEGPPTLERTSRRLGLGARTLQRRLVERRLSYQRLLDQVRQISAARLLAQQELSVEQIAFLLGYADPSGFRRAHRRWNQRAPRRTGSA